jgi:hypothetical protein
MKNIKDIKTPLSFLIVIIISVTCGYWVYNYEMATGAFDTIALALINVFVMIFLLNYNYKQRRSFDLFEPINIIFLNLFIGYVARSIYISLGNYGTLENFTVADANYYISIALIISAVGLIAFGLGYNSKFGHIVYVYLINTKMHLKNPIIHRLPFLIAIYSFIGLSAFYFMILENDGFQAIYTRFSAKRELSSNYMSFAAYLFFFGVLLQFWRFISGHKGVISRLSLVVSFIIASMIPFWTSSRGTLFLWWIIFAILYHYKIRKITFSYAFSGMLVLLIIYMLMLGIRANKGQTTDIRLSSYLNINKTVGTVIGGRDFADIVTLAHIVRAVPDQLQLEYGKTLWVLITRPVPRSIWPNKPSNHGIHLKKVLFNRWWLKGGETPPTLIGEFYWNFHFPGVIVGMLLFGIIMRTLYEYVRQFSDNLLIVTLYGITIYGLMKTLNHDLSIGLTSYLVMLSYVVLTVAFTGFRKQKPSLPFVHHWKKVF